MDEVDNIIFQNFLSLGWEKEDGINSLLDLEVSEIAKLMVKCLYAINSECDLPQSLPHNMSQRFRTAARIAESIKDLGYNGDLGYQSILYSNEADLRRIFTFLIEKLPKDAPALTKEPLEFLKNPDKSEWSSDLFKLPANKILPTLLHSHAEQLGRTLSSQDQFEKDNFKDFTAIQSESTISSSCKYGKIKRSDLTDVFKEIDKDHYPPEETGKDELKLEYCTNSLDTTTSLETQATDVEKLQKAKEKEDNEMQLSALSLQISQFQDDVTEVIRACEEKETSVILLEQTLEEEEKKLAKEEKKLNLLKKTSSLASDAETNIEKLKNSLQASKEREEKLMNQWLEFKKPLEEELEEAKLKLENKKSKQMEIQLEVSELRKTTHSMIEDAKKKEILFVQLNEQKNKMTKGVNRSVYTKQILDISGKVRKQKQEIEKILSETRLVQKQINNLTGKVQRTFAVVEDASFKAASSNERARPIYRSVVTIHEEFGTLIDIIRDTGSIQRETADLQQQLNSERSKSVEDNLKKLEEDFNKLKIENAALKQKLNSKS